LYCSIEETPPLDSKRLEATDQSLQKDLSPIINSTSHLEKLVIQDFILVKKEEVHFEPGFNVVTGESGAGKSVLIDALSQVLGKTSLGNCIRHPCDRAVLQGTFHLAPNGLRHVRALFRQFDVPSRALPDLDSMSGGKLVIEREIFQTGSGLRSRCFVNGIATSVRVLRALSNIFFDVNGQHSVISLGNREKQLALIDRIAGRSELKQEIADIYKRMTELKSLLSVTSEFEKEEIRDEAQRLCEEVQGSKVAPGEERDLRYTLQVLETHASSVEAASTVTTSLAGHGGSEGIVHALQDVSNRIKSIFRQEQRNAELSDGESDDEQCDQGINCALESLDNALECIEKAEDEIKNAAENVSDFASMLKFDAVDQAEIRQRLKSVEKLLREFQCRSTEELLDLSAETQARLNQYFESCDKRTNWESELATLEEQYIQKSVALSLVRRETSVKLRKAIEDCLYDLAMQKSRFDVRVDWERTQKVDGVYVTSETAQEAGENGDARYLATAEGFDSVEFLLAPGPTEPLRALSGVASGGECARIMLAFKAAPSLVRDDRAPYAEDTENDAANAVLVLDELDTGVGGRLGRTVGRLLRSISTNDRAARNQVICVSHLPQVAAYASNHIRATKAMDEGGNMEIQFHQLKNDRERTEEINAMMGTSENLAYDLLNDARS